MNQASAPVQCSSCGAPVSGRYCSACGAPVGSGALHFVEELPVVGEPVAFVRTFLNILRSPVEEPIRLVETPEYRGHFRFLMIGVGVFVAFVVLAVSANRSASGELANPSQAYYLDSYLYKLLINYTVGAAIAYGLFRLFGSRNAGVLKHAKLWSIFTGFYLPLQMLILIAISLAGLAYIQVNPELAASVNAAFATVGPYFFLAFNLVMALHLASAHSSIWGVGLWKSLALILACVLLAELPAQALHYALGFAIGFVQSLF